MAEIVKNDKGFKILKLNSEDCDKVGFGPVCDNCNNWLFDEDVRYYVPVLNRLFCESCYDEWYQNATRYIEDVEYEIRYFNFYCHALEIDNNE